MNRNFGIAAVSAFFAVALSGQNTGEMERVVGLSHASSEQEAQEIALLTRTMTGLREVAVDAPPNSLTMRGSAAQVAFGEWVVREIDKPEGFTAAPREYEVPDGSGDRVRVFNLVRAGSPRSLQEAATVVRSAVEIRSLFTYPKARAIAARGRESQLAAAEWLIGELEKPAGSAAKSLEHRIAGNPEDAIRAIELTAARSPINLQEVATVLRSTAEIRYVFTYDPRSAIVARGNSSQLAMAEWLIDALDRSSGQSAREYRVRNSDDLVRVYYVNRTASLKDLQEVATTVRSIADIRRVFTNATLRALVLRCNSTQMELAGWMVREFDKPSSEARTDSQVYLYAPPEDNVRVFYLTKDESLERLQEVAVRVRTQTGVRRLFTYGAPRALALRGTASQIAHAERLIKERTR